MSHCAGVRIGVTLPTFRQDADTALAAAKEAERVGLHGVFCFDHLWPMGQPHRPALSCLPMLAAVAATTSRIRLGPLVARVGLLPDEVLLASLLGLRELAGQRLLVALGTGDRKSADEHRRNGLAYLGPAARQESLHALAVQLKDAGVETWVGAGSPGTNAAARAANITLNFWDIPSQQLARESRLGPVTWAGPLPDGERAAAEKIEEVAAAGAGFVVWGWPKSLDIVVAAAGRAGVDLEPRADG